MNRWTGYLLLLMLAAGCATPPEVEHPDLDIITPDSWTGGPSAAGELSMEWWIGFDDPVLTELVDRALEHNYNLKAALARLDRAAADAKIAGADLKPTAGFNFNATRRRQNFIGLPIGGSEVASSTTTSYGVSLDTSWEIDLWGRLRARAGAALADLQAVEADFRGARLSIAGQTVKAFLAVAEANQQFRLAEETVASFSRSTDQVRSRYERGLRSPLDVRLSLSNLADAKALMEQRKRLLDQSKRQLEVLLGEYPDEDVVVSQELPAMPPQVPAGLPADLVKRRPDLAAAERRLAASSSRVAEAEGALYPRLSLTASGGTASEDLDDLLDGDFRVWSLAANLLQPIFEGGRLRAGVSRAKAAQDESLAQYADAVLNAYAEVESSLAAEEFLAEQEVHLAEATMQAKAAQELAEDRYNSGLEEYITVLESQRRALINEGNLIALRRQRLENRVNLYLALGGGFQFTLEDSLALNKGRNSSLEEKAR